MYYYIDLIDVSITKTTYLETLATRWFIYIYVE